MSAAENWQKIEECREKIKGELAQQDSLGVKIEVDLLEKHLSQLRRFSHALMKDRERQANEHISAAILMAKGIAKAARQGNFDDAQARLVDLTDRCGRIEKSFAGGLSG